MKVTRFAPSPTWYVHIWSLRTVLYNYLFAKKENGKFMLRIEDTDRTRLVEWSVENLIDVLTNVWLVPDEWPNNPWDLWPYFQSERLEIYQKYIKQLIDDWKAYYCFCSSERLDKLREEQAELNLPTKYDKKCRYLSEEEIAEKLKSGTSYTVRMKIPDNRDVEFEDVIKWKVKINTKDIDEQILLKSDWYPTYHWAVVIDDHLMWITHVIRGEEWVPSTPKHVLLFEAFGWDVPVFAHLPLLLWKDKKKLSKRTGDVSVENYLEKWYLVEALLNYIALLWWNPKTTEEFFTIDELIERFDLYNVHKAGAVFDVERLNFFNSQYLKTLDLELVFDKIEVYLSKYDKDFADIFSKHSKEYNLKVINELRTRIKTLSEFKEFSFFLYSDSKIPETNLLLNQKMKIENTEDVKKALELAYEILNAKDEDFEDIWEIKDIFIEQISQKQMKNGQVLWPVRCALSWEEFSPWALELIYILWINESKKRISKTLESL